MKRICLSLLLVPLLLGGCARHYVITLNSGSRITTVGKPKLEGNAYVFKNIHGQMSSVPTGRVTEIAPASMVKQQPEPFKPKRSR